MPLPTTAPSLKGPNVSACPSEKFLIRLASCLSHTSNEKVMRPMDAPVPPTEGQCLASQQHLRQQGDWQPLLPSLPPPPPPGAAFPSRNAQQTKPRSGQLDTVAVQLTGHQHLQQSRASYCQHTFACGIYSPISKLSWPVDRHQPTLLIGTAHGAIRFPHTKEEPLFGLAGRAVSVVHWMKSKQAPMWSLLRGTQEPSLTGLNCMCGWLLWCVKQFEPVHVLDSWQAMTVIIRVPWAGDAWCTIANLCRKALQEAWCHFPDPWVPGAPRW